MRLRRTIAAVTLMALAGFNAAAQSTAFTYQGVVRNQGQPVTTPTEFRFSLFDVPQGGAPLSGTITRTITPERGLISTVLDLGTGALLGGTRYLQVEVRATPGSGNFVPLAERQLLTPTPYASNTRGILVSETLDVAIGGSPVGFKFGVDGTTNGNVAVMQSSASESVLAMRNFSGGQSRNYSLVLTGAGSPLGPDNSFLIRDVRAARNRFVIDNIGNFAMGTSTTAARLTVDGEVRCVNLVQTSSSMYKEDVQPLSNALDTLSRLQGVSYTWNNLAPENARGRHDIGFLAEDVAKVLPDVVARDENGNAVGIDYGRFAPVAVEAIKQLKGENDQLKDRLAALEAAVAKLNAQQR